MDEAFLDGELGESLLQCLSYPIELLLVHAIILLVYLEL